MHVRTTKRRGNERRLFKESWPSLVAEIALKADVVEEEQ
jgi:hypothetical protein